MIQESYSRFYDVSYIEELAINAFYGWGYNFYKVENQLRQDDLRVRTRASYLLGRAKDAIEMINGDYRRTCLPPPTKDNPNFDQTALENARTLERLSRSISLLESKIRSLPTPATDRMTQRYRQEAETLAELIRLDQRMIGQLVNLLNGIEENRNAEWLFENESGIKAGLSAVEATINSRQTFLL
jgi:hypothetical protein